MPWSPRGRAALLLAPAVLLLACASECPANGGGTATSVAGVIATPAPAAPLAAAPGGLPGTAALHPTEPRVQVAVETTNDLFLGRYDAVNARLEPRLREQLSAKALGDIVAGVIGAHGDPAQVMDAWAGDLVEEDGTRWLTSSVLLRMSRSPARFRLLLVFNRDESVRGLWLRPI